MPWSTRFCRWRAQIAFACLLAAAIVPRSAHADFHLFAIDQIFTNADGSVQFIVLHQTPSSNSENLWRGHAVSASRNGLPANSFTFATNLPSATTLGKRVLIGTRGFAALGVIAPDYVVPDHFLSTGAGAVNYADVAFYSYLSIPTDGVTALDAGGNPVPNLARNFGGQSASIVAPAAGPNYQGLWWAAPAGAEAGWGINFAHQGDTIFATWFTYDATGKGVWLVTTATKTGPDVYAGSLIALTGAPFDSVPYPALGSPGGAATTTVGTATFTFNGSADASFAYTFGGISQTKAITRQVFGAMPTCAYAATANFAGVINYQDLWWASPGGSEAGWGINLTHQGDTIFATWFTYDHDRTPMWLVASTTKTAAGSYTGTLLRTTGPPFNAVPFPAIGTPGGTQTTPVGSASFTFRDGNDATFQYVVNGATQAKNITRQLFAPPGGTVCQ